MQPPNKLWNKNFLIQWQGQTISRLGTQAFLIGQLFYIKHVTGSAALMGLLAMLSNIPGLLMGPIGGVLADRYSRKYIIIISDLLRGLSGLALALMMFIVPERETILLVSLFSVSIFQAVINPVFGSAIQSTIPDLVPEEKVASANSVGQLSIQAAVFFGQMIGGTLYRLFGAAVMFLIDSFSYFYSSGSEFFVQIPQAIPEKSKDWKKEIKTFIGEISPGFKYVWSRKGLREMVFVSALLAFFSTPIIILLPFYIEDVLKVKVDWYGYMLALTGVGTVIGYLLAGILNLPANIKGKVLLFFIFLDAVGFGLLGLVRDPYLAVTLAFLAGASSGFITVNITTILQISTPANMRGRVFGLLATISSSLTPLAMGLSGVIADLLDQNIPLIYISCGIIMSGLVLLIALNKDFRDFLAYQTQTKTIPAEPVVEE
jgi:DHA3 family macrolide efflux protein-like MFS transporter